MRILLAEDDRMLADAIARALSQSAHSVDVVHDGKAADLALSSHEFDLAILDLGLPYLDGFEVVQRLRARRSTVPTLILSVRDSVEDRVNGLDIGADDYLTKPFHLYELEARVRALIRRAHAFHSPEVTCGDLRLDVAGRRIYHGEQPIDLTAREFATAELLLMRPGRVVTRQTITDHLDGWGEGLSNNAIEVLIHRVRRKLEPCGVEIRTIRGMGYLLEHAR